MIIKRLFRLLLLILCSAKVSHAQDSSAPYLYYFSDLAHGFVIERADRQPGAGRKCDARKVYAVAISGDGRLLAGSALHELNWYARAVSFHPTRNWLAAGGSQMVTIWDLSDLSGNH